jgi:hypothetical protein
MSLGVRVEIGSQVLRFVGMLTAASILAACQVSPGIDEPMASQLPDPFAGLPYALDLPDGWIGGDPVLAAEQFDELNPELARQILADAPQAQEGRFTAWDTQSTDRRVPALGMFLLPAPAGWTTAELLDEAEQQNRTTLEGLVGLIGPVTMDRVALPFGEALRGRWRIQQVVEGGETVDVTNIAYVFVSDQSLCTVAFTAMTNSVAAHEQEFLTIVSSFQRR